MGCDIHGFIESREDYSREKSIYWSRAKLDLDRDYTLFGLLAGVRGAEEPIVYDKGLPLDLSGCIKESWEEWGCDAHTPSWLNREEALEVLKVHQTEDMQAIVALLSVYNNSRFVFWFDN